MEMMGAHRAQIALAGGELRLFKATELHNSGKRVRSDANAVPSTAAPLDARQGSGADG